MGTLTILSLLQVQTHCAEFVASQIMYNCTQQNCIMNEYARQYIHTHHRGGGGHMEFSQIASQCYDGDGKTHMAKLTDVHVPPQNANTH